MVYFICRSQYESPLGHRLVEFQHDGILEWFQELWEWSRIEGNSPWDCDDKFLGGGVYGFGSFIEKLSELESLESETHLKKFLNETEYTEGCVSHNSQVVEVLTDDDEIDIAWYLFDHKFAEENPDKVEYLLRKELDFPTSIAEAKFKPTEEVPLLPNDKPNAGTTWCVFLNGQDGLTITDVTGGFRVPGVRIADFLDWLIGQEVEMVPSEGRKKFEALWTEELLLLRGIAQITEARDLPSVIQSTIENEMMPWGDLGPHSLSNAVYKSRKKAFFTGNKKDCNKDMERLRKFVSDQNSGNSYWTKNVLPSRLQCSDHLIRCLFTIENKSDKTSSISATSWTFFDDLWAASHPHLANSLLNLGRQGGNALFYDV